jgi:hypothetical protein
LVHEKKGVNLKNMLNKRKLDIKFYKMHGFLDYAKLICGERKLIIVFLGTVSGEGQTETFRDENDHCLDKKCVQSFCM